MPSEQISIQENVSDVVKFYHEASQLFEEGRILILIIFPD